MAARSSAWHDAEKDRPKSDGEYLCLVRWLTGGENRVYRDIEDYNDGKWTSSGYIKVLYWTEIPENPPDIMEEKETKR